MNVTNNLLKEKLELDLDFSAVDNSDNSWNQALILRIDELIVNDFERLVAILYRLDINELKLKQLLKDHAGKDAGAIIAGLIIDREREKIKSRDLFKGKNDDIGENEKW